MKILYIGNQLESRKGSPTSVDVLTPLLEREGYTVVSASGKESRVLRLADMLYQVYKHRKDSSFVLIDTYSTQNFWYALAVGQLCRKLGLKYIPILHGGGLPQRLRKSPQLSKNFFINAHVNVAPSQFLQAEFEAFGFRNVMHIPNSVNIEDYRFKARKVFRPKILWVRAFAEVYNPMLALQIVEILYRKYPETELYMVGPAKDESLEICRRLAAEKKLPIRFPGKVSKKHWIRMAEEFDIFINTSNVDNTPVSVIEAMALGLPVVSTDVGGMPFLIEHEKEGVLVPPNNVVKMTEGIEKILRDNKNSRQIAEAARAKVEDFDWKKIKGGWKKLLSH